MKKTLMIVLALMILAACTLVPAHAEYVCADMPPRDPGAVFAAAANDTLMPIALLGVAGDEDSAVVMADGSFAYTCLYRWLAIGSNPASLHSDGYFLVSIVDIPNGGTRILEITEIPLENVMDFQISARLNGMYIPMD